MKRPRITPLTLSIAVTLVALGVITTACAITSRDDGLEPEHATSTSKVATPSRAVATPSKAVATPSEASATKLGHASGNCPADPNTPGGADPFGGCWPGPHNTGYPRGLQGDKRTPVTLTPYNGPCNIDTDNTLIDSQEINCERLRVTANNVTIANSLINGRIDTPNPDNVQRPFSFTLTDTTVAAGQQLGEKAIKLGNMVLTRVEISGATNSVTCNSNCTITDSWLHDQATDPEGVMHVSALRQGGNGVYKHNSIICEAARGQGAGGACSGAITGYGDLTIVQNNLVERNLILAGTSSVCVYGGSGNGRVYADKANRIRFLNNVFSKGKSGHCGIVALIAAWNPDLPGNAWEGNTYLEDGSPANPG